MSRSSMPMRASFPRSLLRIVSYVAAAVLGSALPAPAQVPDTARAIARLDSALLAAREVIATEVWPGFDVSRVGLLYMLPGTGKVLARWPGEVAESVTMGGSLIWTTARVAWEREDAVQVVPVSAESGPAQVLGLALHEGFHVHQEHFADSGSVRFVENSMMVPRYPLFDAANEAAVAAEYAALRAAVEAGSVDEARRLAASFIGLRRMRQARLPAEVVEFERMGEAHEGLAQYVLLRGLDALGRLEPALRQEVARAHAAERDVLTGTLDPNGLSVRRRLYATGSQMGLLLDRLVGETWKKRVEEERVWLDDLVEAAAGRAGPDSASLVRLMEARLPAAVASVGRLQEERERQRREILRAPGTLVVLSPAAIAGGRFQQCGFDPQNLLPDGQGNLLHTRMVRVCGPGGAIGGFDRAVVEDALTGDLRTRMEAPRITSGDTPITAPARGESLRLRDLRLTSDAARITADEALLVGTEEGLLILPLR